MFRVEAISALAGFHVGPQSWSDWIWSVGFCRGRKTGKHRRKNPQSKARTNNKLNPHMASGWSRTRATLVGGEHSHYCTILALQA